MKLLFPAAAVWFLILTAHASTTSGAVTYGVGAAVMALVAALTSAAGRGDPS